MHVRRRKNYCQKMWTKCVIEEQHDVLDFINVKIYKIKYLYCLFNVFTLMIEYSLETIVTIKWHSSWY